MAKAPRLGTVKTRLADALDEASRLELYRAFLLDKIDQALVVTGVTKRLAFAPADAEDEMRALVRGLIEVHPQRGDGLGERLANVARDAFAAGAPAVLLIDSDTPTLPVSLLKEAAIVILSPDVDVVVGPATDGGYYLIGLKSLHLELFTGIAWSTSQVLVQTIAACANKGLRMHLLETWYDVDTPDDLERLTTDLDSLSTSVPGYPLRTATWIKRRKP